MGILRVETVYNLRWKKWINLRRFTFEKRHKRQQNVKEKNGKGHIFSNNNDSSSFIGFPIKTKLKKMSYYKR